VRDGRARSDIKFWYFKASVHQQQEIAFNSTDGSGGSPVRRGTPYLPGAAWFVLAQLHQRRVINSACCADAKFKKDIRFAPKYLTDRLTVGRADYLLSFIAAGTPWLNTGSGCCPRERSNHLEPFAVTTHFGRDDDVDSVDAACHNCLARSLSGTAPTDQVRPVPKAR
jgi:hypothetical protein